jgi:glyoxylase-like metal-dependent hydrolase (beta-lactamase superfamily II)
MKQLADDVWQLSGFPPNAINVYVIGDVLIDAASKRAHRRIMRQLRDRTIAGHALTHVHADHQGSSAYVCEQLGIPLMCGEGDVYAMETEGEIRRRQPKHWLNTFFDAMMTGPPRKVDRVLREGDEVAGFKVLEVPGHSAGHVAFWRESDRTLIAGDVLNAAHPLLGTPGLREPLKIFTPDPVRNRESARRLAALEPALVCLGHGPPVRDTRKFVEFVNSLSA